MNKLQRLLDNIIHNEKYSKKIMLLPAFLLLVGIMIPFLYGIFTSMTNKKLYDLNYQFVFLKNYISNFTDPVFLTSLSNTFLYVLFAIAMQIPLGILIAVLLDIPSRTNGFLRTILIFPLLIPPIVSSLMWKTMMQPNSGVLNYLITKVGFNPFPWLTDTGTVLFSLSIIDTWIYLPFVVIILLSGLQSLPHDQIEAAQVDGASPLRVFFSIKLRWLVPSLILVLVFRVCDSLKSFEIIYATTKGGPMHSSKTLNILGYEEAFQWSNIGQSMSVVFTLWIIAFFISSYLMKKWNNSAIE